MPGTHFTAGWMGGPIPSLPNVGLELAIFKAAKIVLYEQSYWGNMTIVNLVWQA